MGWQVWNQLLLASFLAPCMEVGIGGEDIEGGIQSKL